MTYWSSAWMALVARLTRTRLLAGSGRRFETRRIGILQCLSGMLANDRCVIFVRKKGERRVTQPLGR